MPVNKVVYGETTLIDLTDSTVTSGDLRTGIVAYDKSGARIVGNTDWSMTSSGGTASLISGTTEDYLLTVDEGAVRYVTGTFTTGSTGGKTKTVTIPYDGTGYPIACIIMVTGGAYNSGNSTWYDSTQQYAVGQWTMTKASQSTAPTYTTSGAANRGVTTWIFKNSTTSATTYSRSSAMTTNAFSSSDATADGATCCRFKSSTSLSVYIASTSYGLLPGLSYTYHIIYSA